MVHLHSYLQTDTTVLLFYLISDAKRMPPFGGTAALSWSCHYILLTGLLPFPDLFRVDVDAKPNIQTPALLFLPELPTRELRFLSPSERNHLTLL